MQVLQAITPALHESIYRDSGSTSLTVPTATTSTNDSLYLNGSLLLHLPTLARQKPTQISLDKGGGCTLLP
jgi:hypothetical protein